MSRILVISGPTASGKSDLALKFSQFKDIDIINADALQIYQGLPILASQPSDNDKNLAPHFLYGCTAYNQNSSVANWLNLVAQVVTESWQKNRLPVIVGGSGMYISKLIEGISEIPEISDEIKNLARQEFEEIGKDEFQKKLLALGEANILDKQRMIRAYEVLLQTKKSINFWQAQPKKKLFPQAEFFHINLNPNRQELYKNCDQRFEKMLSSGAIDEVQSLIRLGVNAEMLITKTLGFEEISAFLAGQISRDEVVKIASQKTRNYAKRQLTWFRHQLPEKSVFATPQEALNDLKNF